MDWGMWWCGSLLSLRQFSDEVTLGLTMGA